MSQSGRDAFWDNTRAVLMWFVVLGHTIQHFVGAGFFSHPLFKAIYLFHIPLFFFISGYFALPSIRKHRFAGLKKTTFRLLTPIFTIGSLQLILLLCQENTLTLSSVWKCYVCLWFLWSLFECQFCAYLLLATRILILRLGALCLPMLLCLIAPKYIPYADYLGLAWPCFIVGMFARHKGFSRLRITYRWYWATPAAILCFLLFQNDWYVYTCPLSLSLDSIGVALFRLVAALTTGCVFLALMNQCADKLHMATIGTATLGIYIVQSVLFKIISHLHLPACISQTWIILAASLAIFYLSYLTYALTKKVPIVGTLAYGDTPSIHTKPVQ